MDGEQSRTIKPLSFTPIKLPFSFKSPVLALGSEIKSSFSILVKDTVFISRVFGDLREPRIFEDFRQAILNEKKEFGFESDVTPKIVACDLHPEYISTKFANEIFEKSKKHQKKVYPVRDIKDTEPKSEISNGVYLLEIQHHHAHIASCMAENGLHDKVIGVAFDGTGYGSDGNIWGGEFLLADYYGFDKAAHLAYIPMPGADKAVLEPIRMAFSYLYKTYKGNINRLKSDVLKRIGKERYSIFAEMIDKGINSPLTSSAGRLFDAVSSIVGIKDYISYEGEAAIELEKIASDCEDIYEFAIGKVHGELALEFWPMIKAILSELKQKKPLGLISRKFHNTLAEAIKKVCSILRKKTKLNDVALSGGVFQNKILLFETKKRLENARFSVYVHSRTSCADRSLSLGQAVIAASKVASKKCA